MQSQSYGLRDSDSGTSTLSIKYIYIKNVRPRFRHCQSLLLPRQAVATVYNGVMMSLRTLVTFLFALLFVRNVDSLASTDTITWGGDNSRAGYQTCVKRLFSLA